MVGRELQLARGLLNNEIRTLIGQGQLSRAEKRARVAVRDNRRCLGRRHPNTLNAQLALSVVLWQGGSLRASEALQRSSLRTMEQELGQWHDDTRTARDNLVVALRQRGRHREAEQLAAVCAGG